MYVGIVKDPIHKRGRIMDVDEVKLGDTVRVNGIESVVVCVYQSTSCYEIYCEAGKGNGSVLDEESIATWTASISARAKYAFLPNWKEYASFDKYYNWTSSVECIVKRATGASACAIDTKSRKLRLERPCPQCKRMNDIGVSQCWHCERPNP